MFPPAQPAQPPSQIPTAVPSAESWSGRAVRSQIRLNRLLDLEEESYYESRRAPQDSGSSPLEVQPPSDVGRYDPEGPQPPSDGRRDPEPLDGARPRRERAGSPARVTTLMVRNIDWRLSSGQVSGCLHELGFEGTYDYLHLPVFRSGRSNQGFFFVNFRAPEVAESFRDRLQGRAFGAGARLCTVEAAKWQGLRELREGISSKAKPKTSPLFL